MLNAECRIGNVEREPGGKVIVSEGGREGVSEGPQNAQISFRRMRRSRSAHPPASARSALAGADDQQNHACGDEGGADCRGERLASRCPDSDLDASRLDSVTLPARN